MGRGSKRAAAFFSLVVVGCSGAGTGEPRPTAAETCAQYGISPEECAQIEEEVRRCSGPRCTYDGQCAPGALCSQRWGCAMPGTCGVCRADFDCPDRFRCELHACKTSCISRSDCVSGAVCAEGKCVTPGTPGSGTCSVDSHCAPGYACELVRHECRTSCISRSDCQIGWNCRRGECTQRRGR